MALYQGSLNLLTSARFGPFWILLAFFTRVDISLGGKFVE